MSKEAEAAATNGGREPAVVVAGPAEVAVGGVMQLAPFQPLDLLSCMHERLGAMISRSKKLVPPPPPPPPATASLPPHQPPPAACPPPPPGQQQRSQPQQLQPAYFPASGAQGAAVGAEANALAIATGNGRSGGAATGAADASAPAGAAVLKALQPQQHQRPPAAATTSKVTKGHAAVGSGATKAKQQASRPLWPTLDLRPTGSISKKKQ